MGGFDKDWLLLLCPGAIISFICFCIWLSNRETMLKKVWVVCPVCDVQVGTEKEEVKKRVMEMPLERLHRVARGCDTCKGDLWPLILMDPWVKELVEGKEELKNARLHANAYVESLAHLSDMDRKKDQV